MDKKKAKKPTDQKCFNGTDKFTNGCHGYISVILCVFYFPKKHDPLENTPRKAEGFAYQDIVRRLLKWASIFKENYSLPQTFD